MLQLGCEDDETEFAIRVRRGIKGAELMHVPGAVVRHHVEPGRVRVGYFFRRCFSEGISELRSRGERAAGAALSSERHYVLSTLPRGVLDGLGDGFRGDTGGFARAAMIVAGLSVTAAGFVLGGSDPTELQPDRHRLNPTLGIRPGGRASLHRLERRHRSALGCQSG